jgi:UDP-glucose 4-epimerase
MESSVLIVGGAGYIGSHVNKFLSGRGYKTVVFDNLSTGHRELVKWGEFFKGDLADSRRLDACFGKYKIGAVMHFSAFACVGESVSDPAKYYGNNVANTLNLLNAMKRSGVGKFIFSSSCAVYGVPVSVPIRENHPFAPISPYGRTKNMVEEILADYEAAYGIKHVNLRYFNAAGADPGGEMGEIHDPETHLIPLALAAAAGLRGNIKIFGTDYKTGDGTCVRDYVHVCDLAAAHESALRYLLKGGSSDSFNLGTGRGFSVREVIEAARKVTGRRIKVSLSKKRPGDPPVLIAGSAKARRVLGWKPEYPGLNEIIGTAWRWHTRA